MTAMVMSDWGAVNDRVKGVPAGLELEMPDERRAPTTGRSWRAVRGRYAWRRAVLDTAVRAHC